MLTRDFQHFPGMLSLQIASCICLSTPGYTHKTIHIFHQLFFITLSVADVICDFGCFINLFVISM